MTRMASLVELTVATVALHTPVPELLAYIEYLPTFIRHRLLQKLSKFRLREMEVAWEAAANVEVQKSREGFDPLAGDKFLFDRETQREWEARFKQCDWTWRLDSDSWDMEGWSRNWRHVFWGEEFESMLSRRTEQDIGHVDELMENQRLFVEVVRELELIGDYICKDNEEIFLALRNLRCLQVNFLDQNFCWKTMRRLIKEIPHLTELKFACGSLSDSELSHLFTALVEPTLAVENRVETCRITVLEFVRVETEGYHMFITLVESMPQLLHLKVEDCITNFNKNELINVALCLPALERLFLGTDWLEDDAFDVLKDIQEPLALRHLRLYNNNVSLKIVKLICQASVDGVLNLERLELSDIYKIRDSGIHALTALLASRVVGSATMLTHLDLRGGKFGRKGVTNLLLALGHNKTLTHLNIGHNDFGVGFGDILADFLLTNSSVTHLGADFVHLTQAGVSARMLTALECNLNLTSLSLVENLLRSGGASAILRALVKRAQVKPFAFVDLSKNEIDPEGLKMIADIFECYINVMGMTQADSIRSMESTNGRDEVNVASRRHQRVDSCDNDRRFRFLECDNIVLIEELHLLENIYCKHERENPTLIKSIQRCVGHLESDGGSSYPQ